MQYIRTYLSDCVANRYYWTRQRYITKWNLYAKIAPARGSEYLGCSVIRSFAIRPYKVSFPGSSSVRSNLSTGHGIESTDNEERQEKRKRHQTQQGHTLLKNVISAFLKKMMQRILGVKQYIVIWIANIIITFVRQLTTIYQLQRLL